MFTDPDIQAMPLSLMKMGQIGCNSRQHLCSNCHLLHFPLFFSTFSAIWVGCQLVLEKRADPSNSSCQTAWSDKLILKNSIWKTLMCGDLWSCLWNKVRNTSPSPTSSFQQFPSCVVWRSDPARRQVLGRRANWNGLGPCSILSTCQDELTAFS